MTPTEMRNLAGDRKLPATLRKALRYAADDIEHLQNTLIYYKARLKESDEWVIEARNEIGRLLEIGHRGCDCSQEDVCKFARERDEALQTLKD